MLKTQKNTFPNIDKLIRPVYLDILDILEKSKLFQIKGK